MFFLLAAEPKGWAHTQRIGWGTGNTGSSGSSGSSGSFLRRGARGKALANSPFFARALSVLLVFPVLPELGLKSVSGRAGGKGTHAKDLLGRTDENGQKRTETVNSAGVPGEWLSVAFRFPPLIPVRFRFFRRCREKGAFIRNPLGEEPMNMLAAAFLLINCRYFQKY